MKRKMVFFIIAFILSMSIIIFILTKYFGIDIVIHNYSFRGENTQWIATYEAHSRGFYYVVNKRLIYKRLEYYGKEEKSFNLTYIGDLAKLSAAKKVEYRLSTGEGGTSSFVGVPSRNIFSSGSQGEGSITIPNEYIELTVIIGSSSPETIKMHKSK